MICLEILHQSKIFSIPQKTKDIIDSTSFFPEKSNKKLPILLNIHGGWFAGDKKITLAYMATANEGYLVININYRLAPKIYYISQLIDIIYWIKHNCDKYNGA